MSDPITEVTQVVRAFADCWNRHDMHAFGELFDPNAEFVNVVGLWWKGRDEITKAHALTHAMESPSACCRAVRRDGRSSTRRTPMSSRGSSRVLSEA